MGSEAALQGIASSRRLLPGLRTGLLGACLAGAFLAVVALYSILAQAPAAGTFHDDGIYLVTAKALAEGRGYHVISIPGEPPQTKYPIVFPWLLSLVWHWHPSFPANLPWLRLVPLTGTLTWLGLTWLLLRRLGASRGEATAIVLVTAVSPWVAFFSTALMSESVFAAIFTGSLLVMTQIYQGRASSAGALLAGVLAGIAALTRTAGLAPACAGLLVLVLSRQWRLSAIYVAGVIALTVPWFVWVSHESVNVSATDAYYSVANYRSWNIIANFTWAQKFHVLSWNVLGGGVAVEQIWNASVPGLFLRVLLGLVTTLCVARGLNLVRRQPAAVLTAAYCAIHVGWAWPPLRFLVPVIPMILWFGFLGVGRTRWLGSIVVAVLLSVGVFQLSAVATHARERGTVWPVATDMDDWNETSRLFSWISEKTPRDAVVTGNLDPMYYLFTGRQAVRAFDANPFLLYYDVKGGSAKPLGTPEDFRKRLLAIRADYLIVTPGRGFPEVVHLRRLVSQLSENVPGSLMPVVGSVDAGYVVYKINRELLGSRSADTRRYAGV